MMAQALRNRFPSTPGAPGRLLRCLLAPAAVVLPWMLSGAVLAADASGFIYGKVTTERGTEFTGRMRWGGEETFWGDFFNSRKTDRGIPRDVMRKSSRGERRDGIRVFGYKINIRGKASDTRLFKARFGDIQMIRPRGGDHVTVLMRDGREMDLDGGSNDIGAKITVHDEALGEATVPWDTIDKIEFMGAPRSVSVDVTRLYGTVRSSDGEFTGYIQWDQDECLSSDELDGTSRDAELSLAMGSLASIERRSSKSSEVVLKDGRSFILSGSNDVDDDNRGIFIENDEVGRVLVPWDEFRKVTFKRAPGSGPDYDSYGSAAELRGKVTTLDGDVAEGRLFYDLDEAGTWEILDGNRYDIEYSIPFELIARVEPKSGGSSKITLRSGRELILADGVDVGDGNDGVLILEGPDRSTYVPWREIDTVEIRRR